MWAIAEVCERPGLSPRTMRHCEEIGLLPGARRRAGGRRVDGPDELTALRAELVRDREPIEARAAGASRRSKPKAVRTRRPRPPVERRARGRKNA